VDRQTCRLYDADEVFLREVYLSLSALGSPPDPPRVLLFGPQPYLYFQQDSTAWYYRLVSYVSVAI
jgi:hypothetical protein